MGIVSNDFDTLQDLTTGMVYTTKTLDQLMPFGADIQPFLAKYALQRINSRFPLWGGIRQSVKYADQELNNWKLGINWNPRQTYIIPCFIDIDFVSGTERVASGLEPYECFIQNASAGFTSYPAGTKLSHIHLVDFNFQTTIQCIKEYMPFWRDDGTLWRDRAGMTRHLSDLGGVIDQLGYKIAGLSSMFYTLKNGSWVENSHFMFMAVSIGAEGLLHNDHTTDLLLQASRKSNFTCNVIQPLLHKYSVDSIAWFVNSAYPYGPQIANAVQGNYYYWNEQHMYSPTNESVAGYATDGYFYATLNSLRARFGYDSVNMPDAYSLAWSSSNTWASNMPFYQDLAQSSSWYNQRIMLYNNVRAVELMSMLPCISVNRMENAENVTTIDQMVNSTYFTMPTFSAEGGCVGWNEGTAIRSLPYYRDVDMAFGGENSNPGTYTHVDIDFTNYDPETETNIPNLSTIGVFNTSYGISQNTLNSFANYLWNSNEVKFEELVENMKMFNNPIDGIIGIRLYPFDVTSVGAGVALSDTDIMLGRNKLTNIKGRRLLPNWYARISMGELDYVARYGNFLDYEPYTRATLFLPYIGATELPCNYFIGHHVKVQYVVDITTGSCSAMVFSDSTLVKVLDGVIGIDIPVSAINRQDYVFNKANNTVGTVASGLGAVGNLLQGNLGAALSGAVNTLQSSMQGQEIKADITKSSASTPTSGLWQPQNCYLVIERALPEIPESYGHNVGYLCNETHRLSDLTGFTQCINPHLDNIACTEVERAMLAELLTSGIIL